MNKVDISDWKDFQISRLFRISSPASRSIKTYNEGDVPYVSSGSINNGIISYLEPNEDEELEKGNCITVSPLDGSSFYQEDDFLGRGGAGSAISLLYNDNLTRYNALFICTVIKIMAQKFDYNDALRMLGVVGGAILYYIVIAVVLWLGLETTDLKLISALIVAAFLDLPHLKGKYAASHVKRGGGKNA